MGLLVLLLGPVAWWATPAKHLQGKDKADVRNATRQVLLAGVGGLVLLTGAGFTARTFFLARRGQLTDRYTKAIAQLASDKLTERLGGIYALEHLMIESARDHTTVVDVLAAFIREQTRDLPLPPDDNRAYPTPRPATDVQAALSVLARRPERTEPVPPNLSQARLRRGDLTGMRLAGARLDGTDLHGADLTGVDLRGARLHEVDLGLASLQDAQLQGIHVIAGSLEGANFSNARLDQADFAGLSMRYAVLHGARLPKAAFLHVNMKGATFLEARLPGADLRQALELTQAQVRDARIDQNTRLPDYLSVEVPSLQPPTNGDLP